MDSIEITITTDDVALQELLIAQLDAVGFESFEQEDTCLKAFMKGGDFDENLLNKIVNKHHLNYSKSIIKEQNWNAIWESNFQPVTVHNFVGIRAGFHAPIENMQHEIIITPKMSFGTGHHATTFMMIELMQTINFKNKAVVDFGTGTGILAILASKLGATNIWAVDNDDWCIENATENIAINNCNNITIEKVNHFSSDKQFDIIIANINKNIILDNIDLLQKGLLKEGQLLLSGLLEVDEIEILAVTQNLGFKHINTLHKNGWIAVYLIL